MNVNDSFDQDLEMDVTESEDVKGGASVPRRRLPNGRGRLPKKQPKQQVSATSPKKTVNTVRETVNPERPVV